MAVSKTIKDRNAVETLLRDERIKKLRLIRIAEAKKLNSALKSSGRGEGVRHSSGGEVTRLEYERLPLKQTYTAFDFKESLQGNEYPGVLNSYVPEDITEAPSLQTSRNKPVVHQEEMPVYFSPIIRDLHTPIHDKSTSFAKEMPVQADSEHIMHHISKEGDIYYSNLIKILNKFKILESDTIDSYIYAKLKKYGEQISKSMHINNRRIEILEKTVKKLKNSSKVEVCSNGMFRHHTVTHGPFPELASNSSADISKYISKYDYRKKYNKHIKVYNPLLNKYSNLKNNTHFKEKIGEMLRLPTMTVLPDKADASDKTSHTLKKIVETSTIKEKNSLIPLNEESFEKKPQNQNVSNVSYDTLIKILTSFGIDVETYNEAHVELIRYTDKINQDIRELREKELGLKKEVAALQKKPWVIAVKRAKAISTDIFSHVDKPIKPIRIELKINKEFREKYIRLKKRIRTLEKNYKTLKHEKSLVTRIKPKLNGIIKKPSTADYQVMAEKRKAKRKKKRLLVTFSSNGIECKGFTCDLSLTGMYIITRKPFNPGVPVEISLNIDNDYTICVRGYSVRAINTGFVYINNGMGIQLDSESEAYRNFLGL